MRLGLISDTHGLLRSEALEGLRGVDHILHAGDIGNEQVLHTLRAVAPVTAVRGNNDHGPWAEALPLEAAGTFGGVLVHVVHDVATLTGPPRGTRVVVAGHSHKPAVEERDGVLYINPGSAGPRRFSLPVTIAHLDIEGGAPTGRIVHVLGEGDRAKASPAATPRTRRSKAPAPEEGFPDARDGLTERERIVLWVLANIQKERGGRDVPLPQLYGHVVEHLDMTVGELQAIVQRLGARRP